jgi:hypothetical protein
MIPPVCAYDRSMTGDSTLDAATWQALGLVLTLVGLALSAFIWARRGPARGLRAAAWSLVPLAAALTGVLRLGGDIVGALVRWAARLVFSPVVWLGLVVAVVAVVLFVVSGWLLRRDGGARRSPVASGSKAAVAPARTRPAAPEDRADRAAPDDMADIEEILRKHGIQ